MMKILYQTEATAAGGRNGHAETKDGAFKVDLAMPKELGGPGGGNNPEQLFASGYSACFLSALKGVAGGEKVHLPDETTVTAAVGLGALDGGKGYGLDVELTVAIPDMDKAEAKALVEKAHMVCPYSNATRGGLDVRLKIA